MLPYLKLTPISSRIRCIKELSFPKSLSDKIKQQHDYATDEAIAEWKEGFKRFLELQLRKPSRMWMLGMPSEGIDSVWHASLLHTRWYASMCDRCLGYFLHHEPYSADYPVKSEESRKRELLSLCSTYYLDCLASGVKPDGTSLPLMFAMDKKWKVAGGFHYGDTSEVSLGKADFDVSMFRAECSKLSANHVALRK